MAVHLIFSTAGFNACKDRARDGDHLILLGDGTYCAGQQCNADQTIHVMAEDLRVRGLPLPDSNAIDYNEMVTLCCSHTPVVSWND